MTVKMTLSDALIQFLDCQYVEKDGKEVKFINECFGIFGHGNVLGIGESLKKYEKSIRFYQGKNEQNMALAAIGYAKEFDRLKIMPCTSSIGPGALNMVTAAGTATANRIPLLIISGDTFLDRQPDPVLQQIEQSYDPTITVNDAFKPVTKFWDRITHPAQLMKSCLNMMSVLLDEAETGAVFIGIPQDVQAMCYEYPKAFLEKRVWKIERKVPNLEKVKDISEIILNSQKPLIICGGGVRYSQAQNALEQFLGQTNIPMVETQAGKGCIISELKNNLGGLGVTGNKASNLYASDSDCIISIGTRLSDFTTGSKTLFKNAKHFININVNKLDCLKLDAHYINADAKMTLELLCKTINKKWGELDSLIDKYQKEWNTISLDLEKVSTSQLNQVAVLKEINRQIEDDAIVVGSAGSLPGDLQRLWSVRKSGGYHVEYGFSCMGYEINGAVGVKMANPTKSVYAFCGDGSFLMGNSEIITAIQENTKITVLLFDNSGWGCIENLQNANGGDTFGTVFKERGKESNNLDGENLKIDYATIAKGMGCAIFRVKTLDELKEALNSAKKETKCCLIDIKVAPKTMSPGYECYWRVGVSSFSDKKEIKDAYKNSLKKQQNSKKY